MRSHQQKLDELLRAWRSRSGSSVGLAKDSSNLFRDRSGAPAARLDVRALGEVLQVDPAAGWVDAEGMCPYDALVSACLPQGVMPAVVPQLKSITLGGAAAGVGIEATSFRHGLVHHTLLEIEVLTGAGEVVVATPDNEHADLFFGFPNSYGCLGYALRLKARTLPVKPFVHVQHRCFDAPAAFFDALAEACGDASADFVDGVVFGARELCLSVARFCDSAPRLSDYSFERIYYRSIRGGGEDWLTAEGYIWRWDTDWFWCSKNLLAQNPLVRRLYGRSRLNSRTYTRLMRLNARLGLTRRLDALRGLHRESVIQDVDIPIARAAEFLDFLLREIGILPVWICPIGGFHGDFPLYPMTPGILYVNFGFWDVVRSREAHKPGHFNRLIERQVQRLGGIKSLYSESFFDRHTFDRLYGGAAYRDLKQRYDPAGVFADLYDKCVLRR